MGLTREQLKQRAAANRRKLKEYNLNESVIEKRARAVRERQERINTMMMLLDANWSWSSQHFVQTRTDKHGNRWHTYWTEQGVRCSQDGQPLGGQEGEDAEASG